MQTQINQQNSWQEVVYFSHPNYAVLLTMVIVPKISTPVIPKQFYIEVMSHEFSMVSATSLPNN